MTGAAQPRTGRMNYVERRVEKREEELALGWVWLVWGAVWGHGSRDGREAIACEVCGPWRLDSACGRGVVVIQMYKPLADSNCDDRTREV